MSALLFGLSVTWLLVSLAQLCRRRSVPVVSVVLVVPVVLVMPPDDAQPVPSGEAWLRRQLEGLDAGRTT